MGDFKYNRYNDLVSSIPKGSFYEGAGIVVPFRGKSPTQMRLETSSPNTTYGLFFNEILVGEVTSDANGNIVFSKVLPLGEVEVALLNKTNGRYQYTYVTTRDYAIWLAGHAEALETIDQNIQLLRNNMAIATAEAEALRDVYGIPVKTYNDIGLSTDSYRWMLHELRLGYRNFGGYYKGVETAISAFTQVSPFSYARRMWGPNWFLNHTMLLNNNFLNRSHTVEYKAAAITGVTLDRVEPDCMSITGSANVLIFDAAARTLQWEPDSVTTAETVVVTDGELFLPGPPSTVEAYVLGGAGPFTIVAGTNDKLYLNFDNSGTQVVTLTAGVGIGVAAIVIEINAAIAPLTSASAHGITGGLLLKSTATAGSSILIEPGPANAALDLFGAISRNFVFNTVGSEGISAYKIEGPSLQLGTGSIEFEYDYTADPIVRKFRWRSAIGTLGAYVDFTDTGNYALLDSLSNICTIHAVEEDLYVSAGSGTRTYPLDYNYSAYTDNDYETKGLWVNVDTTLLPAINTSVQVLIFDDTDEGEDIETPDYWTVYPAGTSDAYSFVPSVVSDGRDSAIEPCQSFAYRFEGTASRVAFISKVRQYPLTENLPRGSASPNIGGPGGAYDYEGYDLVFSGYVRNLTGKPLSALLAISFDGGDTGILSSLIPITIDDSDGQVPPTYVSFETPIPADVSISTGIFKDSGIMVSVSTIFDVGGDTNMDVILEGFTAEVKYISSRSLTNATVARSRHRQYFGELIYIWSPDPLTTIEKSYIGLPYALSDRRVPISGVEITDIDPPDSPTGSGVFEYEYNKAVPTYRLRWTPNGTAWAPGAGWVPVTGDGSLTITAPDATTMTLNTTFSLLPILLGTAPVVKSTNLTISSSRSQQGHSRTISPAHSSLDIFDVTEYDTDGDPINLKGVITEADFSLCTLLNMEISSANPFRYSYLSPTVTNVSGEVLSFVISGGNFDADLDYDSDMDYLTTVIYENGIPLPNDIVNNWLYADSNTVRIIGTAFNSTATYTIDYKPICRVTSSFIDMGSTRTDYAWWADYTLWERYDSERGEFEATVPLFFNLNTGRAYLDRRSTMDTSTSRLYVVSGNRQDERTIPKRYWSFMDDFTISIDVSQLQAGQFFLTHNEKRVYEEEFLNVVFEHRSGTDTTACLAAPWVEVAKNENVDVTNLVHQVRMTVSGMADIRDFRLRSMILKGLRLHGTTPTVPSMTNVWGLPLTVGGLLPPS